MYTSKEIERFWSKIDKERSQVFYNGTRCWEWAASTDTSGYGGVRIGGKMRLAHRVSYDLEFGIQENLHVLHHCDNRLCCNPAHLFLGTNQDNVNDMMSKGRHANMKGEENPGHKLNGEKVSEIRTRYEKHGEKNISVLSRIFQISRRQIRRIVIGKSWK